jgi:Cu/Ag efflux pump CusA
MADVVAQFNLSVAVAVGFIALTGVAAETGVGDRASLIFAAPEEITKVIKKTRC